MGKSLAKIFFKLSGWKYNELPNVGKAIILMAPHTSMWDFVLGKIYLKLFNREAKILIKKEAFFWPLGYFLKKVGGIPVDRGKSTGLTEKAIELLTNTDKDILLVITPEGTRKKTKYWKKGFIRIAKGANVPVLLGFLDTKTKNLGFMDFLDMQGTEAEIMERLKKKYTGLTGLRKNKFITGYEKT